MIKNIDKKKLRKNRKRRKGKVTGNSKLPRAVFSRSNRYLYVQAIDDENFHTLVSSSTKELTKNTDYSRKSKFYAQRLAEAFADKLKKGGITNILFDRNGYRYQISKAKKNKSSGKIKVFCEVLRKQGIKI